MWLVREGELSLMTDSVRRAVKAGDMGIRIASGLRGAFRRRFRHRSSPKHQDRIFERFYRVNPGNDGGAKPRFGPGSGSRATDCGNTWHKDRGAQCSGRGSCFSVKFERATMEDNNATPAGNFCFATG
jgi:hypothetical protein